MVPALETSRLVLRPLALADAEQTQVLFPHWRSFAISGTPCPGLIRQMERLPIIVTLPCPLSRAATNGAWTLRLKSAPDQLIGAISLFRSETDNRGFWLGLPWQRQGLMTEACDAVTDYWFDVLKFPVLRVPKAIANAGSRRISEKQGMRVIAREDRDYVFGRLPSDTWEITEEEWRRRREQ